MPTEMTDDEESVLHTQAGEIEATTGRKQRCGWLDLEAIRFTSRVSGTNCLIITKMDCVPFETIRVCDYYKHHNSESTLTEDVLNNAEPHYVDLPGWDNEVVANADTWDELPQEARNFVKFVEQQLGLPVVAIGNGPRSGDLVIRN